VPALPGHGPAGAPGTSGLGPGGRDRALVGSCSSPGCLDTGCCLLPAPLGRRGEATSEPGGSGARRSSSAAPGADGCCLSAGGVGDGHAALRHPPGAAGPGGHPARRLARGGLLPAPGLGQAPEHGGECVGGMGCPQTPRAGTQASDPAAGAMGPLFLQKRDALDGLLEM